MQPETDPMSIRSDSEPEIRNGIPHTYGHTDGDVGSDFSPVASVDVQRAEDDLVALGQVIQAGIFASGERHPVVRTGLRDDIPAHVRTAVWFRDGGRCRLCPPHKKLNGPWHLDHIVPWSAGGPDTTDNLRVLCETHNLERGNRHVDDERPEIPVTWWCSRCYLIGEHVWEYPVLTGPTCPVHPMRYRADNIKGELVPNFECRVHRMYVSVFNKTGEWPAWHQRDYIEDLHVTAYCAHCDLRGLTGVTL